jgi:Ser/Thr protein kinase RdoA (MazF antagonist)
MESYIIESARAFDIDPTTLEPIAGGNSGVPIYKGQPSRGGPSVLKCIRPFNGEPIGVIQGLEYLETLRSLNTDDTVVAVPLRSKKGEIGIQIDIDGSPHVAAAFDLARGTEINHRERGLAFDISSPDVGEPIYERMGQAAGIMHRAATEYPLWWATPTPGIDTGENGKGLAFCFHDWIAMTEQGMPLAPELGPHWAEIGKRIDKIPINRSTFGFIDYDYSFNNMFYDGRRLTVIDHNAAFGFFAIDLASVVSGQVFGSLKATTKRRYWRRFIEAYRAETYFDSSWIPWLHALQDYKRLGFYLINLTWKAEGKDSYDFPMMETRRREMLENRPTFDFDLSLP